MRHLPAENLFYNTTAPGVIIVLNKAKPKDRQGKLFLLNVSRDFVKGDPKNYIPDDTLRSWGRSNFAGRKRSGVNATRIGRFDRTH